VFAPFSLIKNTILSFSYNFIKFSYGPTTVQCILPARFKHIGNKQSSEIYNYSRKWPIEINNVQQIQNCLREVWTRVLYVVLPLPQWRCRVLRYCDLCSYAVDTEIPTSLIHSEWQKFCVSVIYCSNIPVRWFVCSLRCHTLYSPSDVSFYRLYNPSPIVGNQLDYPLFSHRKLRVQNTPHLTASNTTIKYSRTLNDKHQHNALHTQQ